MATPKRLAPPLPPIEVPMIDPATGRVTPNWYLYLTQVATTAQDHENRIAALEP